MNLKDYLESNPSLLLSEKKIRYLLCDVYLNDRLSVNLLMSAFNAGFITEMRESYPLDQFSINRWTKRLVSDYGVSPKKARWAIDTWVSAIDNKLIKQLDDAEKTLKIDQEELRKKQEEEAKILAEEEKMRKEAEELAREEARRSTPDARLRTRDDYNDYYVNPSFDESEKYIYVPCGFGQGDNGFLIYGIKKKRVCTHKDSNVFALVYNYLVRSSTIREDDIPTGNL